MGLGRNEPEQRSNKHDQGNVQRKAGAGLGLVHGVRLVAIGEDGREDEEEGSDAAREGREPPPHCV